MGAYHELFKMKKNPHTLGISCYLVSDYGDFIVCNTWLDVFLTVHHELTIY